MEQYLVFESNNQNFAIDIPQIEKIIEFQKSKQIPDSSDYLLGIIKYNDMVLPIVDLTKRLYNSYTLYKKENKVIVVQWKDRQVGLVVEKIHGIRGFDKEQYEDANVDLKISQEYIQGFIKMEQGIAIVLDTDKVFSPEQVKELLLVGDKDS